MVRKCPLYPFVRRRRRCAARKRTAINKLRADLRKLEIIARCRHGETPDRRAVGRVTVRWYMYYNRAMPISVRLPPRVEQKLAEYCVSHKVTRSEAVKRALEEMLKEKESGRSPYELGKEFFERNLRTKPTRDVARHTKRLLIEHFRGKRK